MTRPSTRAKSGVREAPRHEIEYEPTADKRALVENAAAFGLTQADIAQQLNVDAAQAFPGRAEQRQIQGRHLARCGSLEATMSYYLVERIKAQPNIEVLKTGSTADRDWFAP